jgi:hypothetical protein
LPNKYNFLLVILTAEEVVSFYASCGKLRQEGKSQMRPTDEQNNNRQKVQRLQSQLKENQFTWRYVNFRASQILRRYNKTEFEKKYNTIINNVLERMIYSDVGVILSGIAQSVKGIKSDESVEHDRKIATRLMEKAMWATTSSVTYLFARRRQFPPDEIQFPYSVAKGLTDDLNKIIASMTAQDAVILLGKLSGIYIKTCPNDLFINWAERRNINPNTLFKTGTMEGELLKNIYY